MKEKRVPSRSLSLCAYPALLVVVLVSCALTSVLAFVNPFTARVYFHDWGVYGDTTSENLNFFTFSPGWSDWDGHYILDSKGHITRMWKSNEPSRPELWTWDKAAQSLTQEELSRFEEHYGEITSYNVINSQITALIVRYAAPLQTFHSDKLVIIKNNDVEAAQIIDTIKIFQVDLETDNHQLDLISHCLLWLGSTALAIMGLRKLPLKNTVLLIYVLGLVFMLWVGLGLQGLD